MNRDGLRKIPPDAPTAFIRKRWEGYVFSAEGIDRRFYELCVMAELKNALRSGDVSVAGSRQFRDFEDYFMPASGQREEKTRKGNPCTPSFYRSTKSGYCERRRMREWRLQCLGANR